MRYVVIIFLLFFASCSDDNEDDQTGIGCLTGISKSGGSRILIKCSTRQQFLAGSNTQAGGTASWDSYTNHKWEKCSDCK